MRFLPWLLLLALACSKPPALPPPPLEAEKPTPAPMVAGGEVMDAGAAEQPRHRVVTFPPSGASIAGTVRGETGQPLEGAVVAVVPAGADWHPANEAATARVRSGAGGEFRINDVQPGAYRLSVTAPGHAVFFQPDLKVTDDLSPVGVDPRLGTAGIPMRGTLRVKRGAPLAETWVWVRRKSEKGGDVTYVQTDGQGTFEVLLPPGDYSLGAESGGFVAIQGGVQVREGSGVVTADLSVPPPHPRTPPVPEVARWLKRAAVPLSTVKTGNGFADLQPLKGWLSGAEVVALGEATHGTREFFQLKHRMLEFLVTELGFTVFAIEASFGEAQAVNDYVLTGRSDPAKALAGLHFWAWETEEMLALVRWMRAYNASPAHPKKLKFYGVDIDYIPASAQALIDYLDKVDPAYRQMREPDLTALSKLSYEDSLDREKAPGVLAELIEYRLDTHHEDYARKSSEREWALAARHARVLSQFARKTAAPIEEADNLHGEAKAENLRWILEHEGPGTKLVLWGHNFRVSTSWMSSYIPMGQHLREALGSRLYTFGFAFNQGAFRALPPSQGFLFEVEAERRPIPHTVPPAPVGSLDAALAATGLKRLALNLRGTPTEGPVADFLELPILSRSYGDIYMEEHPLWTTVPRAQYDGLFFIERTQATVAMPTGRPSPPAKAQSTP